MRALLVGIESADSVRRYGSFDGVQGQVGVSMSLRTGKQVVGLGDITVDRVIGAALTGSLEARHRVSVASAWHSRRGDWLTAIRDSGGVVDLEPGDTLEVAYASDTSTSGSPSVHFLSIDAGEVQASPQRATPISSSLPRRFALYQNQPNPFSSVTRLRFDLPKRERVVLDVLDVQGRRVQRVVDAVYPPGYHAVEWGRRERRVAPGVYLYRMTAGTFRDQRKLVVLP